MAETKEPDKCAKCTDPITKQAPTLCTLCEALKYCSVQCRSDDFKSHRDHCNATAQNLQLQALCARCPKVLKQDLGSSIGCDTCSAIIYCSPKCKESNAKEHALFCRIFTNVGPRPSEAHRLHILFPAHEDKMRFIWLPCHNGDSRQETIDSEVDPRQSNTEGFAGFDESGESGKVKYRAVCGYHVNTFIKLHESEQNRSLGLIVNERPVSYFRGNVALAASSLTSEDVDADPVPIDALPCDLPKLLQCLAREESANGSEVKMELTFFDYSESGEQVELSEKQFHERNQEQFEQFRQQNPEQLEQFEQLCRQQ